jgi:hypothetical protein
MGGHTIVWWYKSMPDLSLHDKAVYGIVGQPWQIEAGKDLKAIILPLVPAPNLVNTEDCQVSRGMEWRWITPSAHATWGKNEQTSDLVVKYCGYAVGDRIYLQEKWCEYDGEFLYWIEPDCEVSEHEAEWLSWQPAETMPPEAVQHWYEVMGVRVCPMKALNPSDYVDFGVLLNVEKISFPWELQEECFAAAVRWRVAHPQYPWNGDRYVVVLDVEAVAA